MQLEPLHVFAKNRIIDEPSADEQRELLKALVDSCGPKPDGGGRSAAALPRTNSDFADRLYSAGRILPRAYSYLAFCLKILEISTKGQRSRSDTARLWGYIYYAMVDAETLAGFTRALRADIAALQEKHGQLPQVLENMADGEPEPPSHPLKSVAASMMRAMIIDDDRDGLRELVRWAYTAYEPHLKTLLDESLDVERWLTNVAELLPRLLLKNLVPLHDSVATRDPRIVIAEYTSSGLPPALTDPGLVTRRSTFARTLFTEKEIHSLEQAGQRISEVFAHAYPLLLSDDPKRELGELRGRVMDIARRAGRLKAIQHIETQYRHTLRLPTWFYRELRDEIIRTVPPVR